MTTSIKTLIGEGTTIVGDIHFSGGLHVDGTVRGNIKAEDPDSRLDVSSRGAVIGEIEVAKISINGSVKGDIHVTDLAILGEGAHIEGNVFYNLLEMAAGAAVNGNLINRKKDEPPLALEHRKAVEDEDSSH